MTMQKPQGAGAEKKPKTRDRTINIEGMKDDGCVSKVNAALKTVKDLSVDAVRVGFVKLRSATRDEATAACAAIKTAGFESQEAPRPEPAAN
jgi:copper chaperone CopZ